MQKSDLDVKISGNIKVTPALKAFISNKAQQKLGKLSDVKNCHFTIQPNSSGNFSIKGMVQRASEQFCLELTGREVYKVLTELINNLHEQVAAAFSSNKERSVKPSF